MNAEDDGNKKIPKIVIPKLILKINTQPKENRDHDTDGTLASVTPSPMPIEKRLQSKIFSSDEGRKAIGEENKLEIIPFEILVKKINQNSYRNLENIIEL